MPAPFKENPSTKWWGFVFALILGFYGIIIFRAVWNEFLPPYD